MHIFGKNWSSQARKKFARSFWSYIGIAVMGALGLFFWGYIGALMHGATTGQFKFSIVNFLLAAGFALAFCIVMPLAIWLVVQAISLIGSKRRSKRDQAE